MEQKVIGKTRVLIDGDSKNCRRQECNMGNLICDAMLDYVRFLIILIDVSLVVDVARIFLENNGNIEPVFSLLAVCRRILEQGRMDGCCHRDPTQRRHQSVHHQSEK